LKKTHYYVMLLQPYAPENSMVVVTAKAGIGRIKSHMIDGAAPNMPPASILLHSNESAFGPSPLARAAARAAVSDMERYYENPDRTLAPALARHFGLQVARITVGQGSDDLIARLARAYLGAGTEVIRTVNGYLKVPNYAYANDAEVVSVADDNFEPSVDRMLKAITPRTRMVYLANPENPAGTYLSGAEVRRLHAGLPDNVLLVLDCAYEEYVEASDYEPGHRLVEAAENVVMCRTFSKIFGLAGARVGWMYGPGDVVDTIRRIGLTFPVAASSAAAAVAALDDRNHIAFVRNANLKGRAWLTRELMGLGLKVIPSQTNFVLVKFSDPDKSAEAAAYALRLRGTVLRRFALPAFRDYLRITIGLPDEVRTAVCQIKDFLGERR
jgi:histidinol-phosphate aminotransferase